VMHDAAHRSNVNRRESSGVAGFPLLISVMQEVRYTWMSASSVVLREEPDDSWIEAGT
jgi:hypothetical protein